METNYPRFTQEMKKTHTILIPNMLPLHFSMLAAALEYEGYHVEVLGKMCIRDSPRPGQSPVCRSRARSRSGEPAASGPG